MTSAPGPPATTRQRPVPGIAAVRGPDAILRTLAIVDERPEGQLLHPEFELFRELFARFGIDSLIGDTAELARGSTGGVELGGTPIDLVYQRDTDFALTTPRAAALRAAYLGGEVVVTYPFIFGVQGG